MPYYLLTAGLMIHTCFWGVGLAWLVLPWTWRRWWWVFVPGMGLALQSAVVWAGAHTSLHGTGQYAWASEMLPVFCLLLAWHRRGLRTGWPMAKALLSPPVVLLAGIIALGSWFLLSPMAAAGRGVSSSSLGSCDHADYAAGARVFAEFSREDRIGMMGLSEVTRIGSAEYFFDFWLRLNHFTPSALIAHHSAIFGLAPYRLVSVTAVVFLLLNVPLVYFLSRVAGRLRTGPALLVAGLYVLSPLSAYAVHQGALGQLLAAQGIGLLVVAVALGFREAGTARRPISIGLVMLAAFWLLAGSYNFILIVCLAQAAPWLLGQAAAKAQGRSIARVALTAGAAFAVCMLLFWPRISGIVERFALFSDYDYGWRVPLLTWEGWLGMVRDVYLEPLTGSWRWVLMLGLAVGWTGGLLWAWRRQRSRALAAAALVLPVAMGWTILAWESLHRTNASYDAYKLISVFYPGLLAGLGSVVVVGGKTLRARVALVGLALLLGFNLLRADDFRRRMSNPPLRVNKQLVELGRIENMPEVTSVNIRVGLYWARLWADAFLLRTPHYFAESTYEGRNATPLRGEWDLRYSMLRVLPAAAADHRELGRNFQLVRPAAVQGLQVQFGAGWHAMEYFVTDQWRWTSGKGTLLLTNSQPTAVRVTLRMLVEGVREGDRIDLECNGRRLAEVRGSVVPAWTDPILVMLPPGPSMLTLRPAPENASQATNDPRMLGVALHQLELQLLASP